MNNIQLTILGSVPFSNMLNELEFNNLLNVGNNLSYNNSKISVKVLFAENLKIKELKSHLLQDEPSILFVSHKDFIKRNNLNLLSFHVVLELPIEITSFKEILNILIIKYNFFKKSKIFIKDYEINSNERSITKNKIKVKLTEKELELILALNKNNGLDKSFFLKNIWKYNHDLDTHVFETNLYRLRKKISKYFKDGNFIVEKNSRYFLVN